MNLLISNTVSRKTYVECITLMLLLFFTKISYAYETELSLGQKLNAGDSIYSPNNVFRLTMQDDGNLVVYSSTNRVLWHSNTYVGQQSGNWATLQTAGNFVVYSKTNQPLWHSHNHATSATAVKLLDDGRLTLLNEQNSSVLWQMPSKAPAIGSIIGPGQYLYSGESLYSPNRDYRLVMQSEGNLVLYTYDNRVLWSSGAYGGTNVGSRATLQTAGNFVVYSPSNAAIWFSHNHNTPANEVRVNDDGSVALINKETKVIEWQTPADPNPREIITCEAQELHDNCTSVFFGATSTFFNLPAKNNNIQVSDACESVASQESALTLSIHEMAATREPAWISFSLARGATISLDLTHSKNHARKGNWSLDFDVTDSLGNIIDQTAGGHATAYYWNSTTQEAPNGFTWTNNTTSHTEFRLKVILLKHLSSMESSQAPTSTFHSPKFVDGEGILTGTPGELITSMMCGQECDESGGSVWLEAPLDLSSKSHTGCYSTLPSNECQMELINGVSKVLDVAGIFSSGLKLASIGMGLNGYAQGKIIPIVEPGGSLCYLGVTMNSVP